MDVQEGVEKILESIQGTRVPCDLPDGEPIILRRSYNGVQFLFPDRARRDPQLLTTERQQDEPGISE